MNRYIRCVFGSFGKRLKMEIDATLQNKYQVPYLTYVFGSDNERQLNDMGIKTELLDKRPHPWADTSRGHSHMFFRTKMEAIKVAMQEYDAITFLDWDCAQVNDVPSDIWDKQYMGNDVQCCLQMTKRDECMWREQPNVYLNAGYMYIRNHAYIQQCIDAWDAHHEWDERGNDECPEMFVLDNLNGHNITIDEWINKYETPYCLLPYESRNILPHKMQIKRKIFNSFAFDHDALIKRTSICFIHYIKSKELRAQCRYHMRIDA